MLNNGTSHFPPHIYQFCKGHNWHVCYHIFFQNEKLEEIGLDTITRLTF